MTKDTESGDRAGTISLAEAQNTVEKTRHPRVSKEKIELHIRAVDYDYKDGLTLCIITMDTGFKFVGKSAAADPRNHNAEVGERYAYEDAFKQIWSHEAYTLKTLMYYEGWTHEGIVANIMDRFHGTEPRHPAQRSPTAHTRAP